MCINLKLKTWRNVERFNIQRMVFVPGRNIEVQIEGLMIFVVFLVSKGYYTEV